MGWQPVDTAGGPLAPAVVVLTDVAAAWQDGSLDASVATDGPPRILLVAAEDPAVRAAAAGTHAAVAVTWPDDRERIVEVAAALAGHRTTRSTRDLSIGGACGGVGTTTVTVALAALAAWSGRPALVLTHGAVPVPLPPPSPGVGDLQDLPVWQAATAVPGVAGLKALRLPAPAPGVDLDAGPAALVVRDRGADEDVDVLVARRDRPGLAALARASAAVAVVADTGPAGERALRAAAAGRRVVRVAWDPRVARAALGGRVPAGLPGAWLRALAPVLSGGAR
ncbi:MAG: hypothetical protein KY462_08145 [Actinobacteria bacterium]|nr:hypothetical protein [Actinomycetota bacterium]